MVLAFMMVLTLMPVEQRWAQTDVVLIAALPVIAIIGCAIRVFFRQRMMVSAVDIAVLTWMAYYVGRTWIGAEYPCRTEFLKTSTMFMLYITLRMVPSVMVRILPYFIMVGGVVEALWGAWQLLCGSSRHELFLITGNFNNPGPYSEYLVMAALTALVLLKTKSAQSSPSVNAVEKLKNMAALVTASLCLAVLPATWSRAAFVSIAVCMLWIYRRKYWRYRYALWGILAVTAVTFYYFKQGSADGRMVIWQAALTSWLSSPWFGMGTGGFCHAFAEGMSGLSSTGNINMDSAGVTMYSYNSLVGILTEQGVVGLVICMLTVAIVLWKLYNASRSLFFAVLSLLIFSLFSYPFELLSYRILIVLAALASGERTVNTEQFINRSEELRIKDACLTFSLVFVIPIYIMVKETYEADKEYASFRGMTEEVFLEDYRRLLPQEEDNAVFLFDYARTLRTAKRYNDSNDILRRGTEVSADPMFYVLLGNNYKDMSLYNMAEFSYKKAYAVMPNRIYPLYQLMLLYQSQMDMETKTNTKTSQTCKAKMREVARRVIEMKPKIKSPATDEMQRKAQFIINR